MTNHWVDMQHSKAILVEGSNVAENHPMAFKWIRKAQQNGAVIIHVDPRFTRTSATADQYARIRPGADAAFLNTMINHLLVHKLYDEDFVVTHTNALLLSDEAFDFQDGLFSGFDEKKHKYNTDSWGYQLDEQGKPRRAASLDDPNCVFSRLRKFVSRYTLERRRADHRHSRGADPADRRDDGQASAGDHPLRAGDDAAHHRGAGHPRLHHPPAPAGQHRQAGQRSERAPGRAQRAGRLRHGRAQQLHAGVPQLPDPHPAHARLLDEGERYPPQEVPDQHPEGLLRGLGNGRERFRLRVVAQARRGEGLQQLRHLRERPGGYPEDAVDRRPEPGGHHAPTSR